MTIMIRGELDTFVEIEAVNLPIDGSRRVVCPVCDGGGSHERSFSITRKVDGLYYQCFRESCPTKGILNRASVYGGKEQEYLFGVWTSHTSTARRARIDRAYYGTWKRLTPEQQVYFERRFELFEKDEVIGTNDDPRFVMKVLDRDGVTQGYNVRNHGWTGEPAYPLPEIRDNREKSSLFMNSPESPVLSVHKPYTYVDLGTFVLVEDQISALKVAQAGVIGIALLGVGLDLVKLRYIQQMMPSEVVFALDADASKTAFRLAREYGLAFPRTRVVLLERDLKDVPADDVRHILQIP